MQKIIHHIRKQPEHVRRQILHITTFAAAIVLIFLWIFSLGKTFTNSETQTKIGQDLKPISAIKDNLVNGYNDLSQPSTDSSTDPNSDYLRAQENSL
jgi:uncharacterized membrane protein YvbJ